MNPTLFLHILLNMKVLDKRSSAVQSVLDFMSVLHNLILGIIPSQKCHVNMDLIPSGYGAMDRNLR
jgi:hypothetical protein